MNRSPIIDVHAHILDAAMLARMRKEAPNVRFELSETDAEGGTLHIGTIMQRPYPRGGWDLDRRLTDMDAAGIDTQVVSVLPADLPLRP